MAAARRSVTAHARRSHHPLRVRRARGVLLRPWVRRRRPRVPLCAAWRAHRVFQKRPKVCVSLHVFTLCQKVKRTRPPNQPHPHVRITHHAHRHSHTHVQNIDQPRHTITTHRASHALERATSRLLCRLSRRRAARSPRSQAWPPRSYQSSHATDCTPWSRTSHGRPWSAPPASASLPCHSPLQ